MKRFTKHLVVRFALSGGVAAVVNVAVLSALYYIFGIYYIWASIVAFVASFFISMGLQKFWTFKDRSISGLHWQTAKYLLTHLFGLCINTFFLFIFVEHFNFYVFFAQMCAGFLTGICTLFLSADYVFNTTQNI